MTATAMKIFILALVLAVPVLPAEAHHGNQFINQALEASATEVQLANLAATRAQNPRVKEFAKMVAADHTRTYDGLQDLQNARIKVSGTPTSNQTQKAGMRPDKVMLTRENQRVRDELAKLSGPQFDTRFMDLMVRNHRNSIPIFEEQSRAHGFNTQAGPNSRQKPSVPDSAADFAMDRDTAAFASQTLPTLRNHLQTAESIQKELRPNRTN